MSIFNCSCNTRFHHIDVNTFLHSAKDVSSPFFMTSANKAAASGQSDAGSPSLRDGSTTSIYDVKRGRTLQVWGPAPPGSAHAGQPTLMPHRPGRAGLCPGSAVGEAGGR